MKYLALFIFGLIFWLLITSSLSLPNITIGIIASLITMLFFGKTFIQTTNKLLHPQRYFWLIVYIIIFAWECLKANFDVAYRILLPKMRIKPGIVKVKTNLKTDIGKTTLANSITMTPGTITVDIIDDYFYIHWIYVSSTDPEVYTKKISGRFEKYIKKIFE